MTTVAYLVVHQKRPDLQRLLSDIAAGLIDICAPYRSIQKSILFGAANF
jgi:hypothetical protein